jgi:hypothetical protein
MLSLAFALDEMGMCGEAYEWHCRAAHWAGESETSPSDDEAEAMYWHALGRFCLRHDRDTEAVEVAALAVLAGDFPGRVPIA